MAENASDFVKLNVLAGDKERTEQLLEERMERWMYLQDLAERIACDRAGNEQNVKKM